MYCVAMELFNLSETRYRIDVHKIRYEDLVEDLELEATKVLSFLGLEWESALLHFQTTALTQKSIKTPSHSQVIKGIYTSAKYRWKNYERHLSQFDPNIRPWIEAYGYSN